MILTGPRIVEAVADGDIVLDPFDARAVNPNSYNYRLGSELVELVDESLDPRMPARTRLCRIPDSGVVLEPGRLYLGVTVERIGSRAFVPSLIGRSTTGRLGLWLQVTADLGNLGSEQHWTLEMRVVQPLRVYAGMRIGQVTFWTPHGEHGPPYQGKYHQHTRPVASWMNREWEVG